MPQRTADDYGQVRHPGIIIIGGILHIGSDLSNPITLLALVAVLVATINIAGGFFITHRMLKMFRK